MVHQIRRDSVQAAGQLVAKCEPQLIERHSIVQAQDLHLLVRRTACGLV